MTDNLISLKRAQIKHTKEHRRDRQQEKMQASGRAQNINEKYFQRFVFLKAMLEATKRKPM